MVFQILFEFNLCAIIMSTFVGVAFGSSLDGPPTLNLLPTPLHSTLALQPSDSTNREQSIKQSNYSPGIHKDPSIVAQT